MTTAIRTATLKVGTTVLDVLSGSTVLDEGWAPYGKGTAVIHIPDATTLDHLDPRNDPRVTLTTTAKQLLGAAWVDQPGRIFDLVVRERAIDHVAATVTLQLATDEALLQDYALVSDTADTSAFADQSSVRTIINNRVLAKIGASLAAGTADSTFYVLSDSTNLCTNPSFANNTTDWNAYGGTSGVTSIGRATSGGKEGAQYMYCQFTQATTAPSGGIYYEQPASPYTPGQLYLFRAWVSSSQAGQKVQINSEWKNASGTLVSTSQGAPVTLTVANTWYLVTLVATAPPLAVRGAMTIYASPTGSNWATNNYLNVDGIRISQAPLDYTDTSYFDGSTTSTTEYLYAWSGTAGNSTATRTALYERPADALAWQPGESAYDFVTPIVQQSGLRLFCDEQRVWRLVDSAYSVSGRVTIAEGYNVYTASDTVSRTATANDGSLLWFDAVVLKYTWTDEENVQQVRYDTASVATPTQATLIEVSRPYPGPGTAAYILSRVAGQGRVLDLQAAIDYAATPGMESSVTLPSTPDQTGYTSSVTWDFGEDTMTIGTRGLTDTPEDAYAQIPDSVRYVDIHSGTTYATWAPPTWL